MPVLKHILAEEKDADLVDRAKLGLAAAGPGGPRAAAAGAPARRPRAAGASAGALVRMRIYEKGAAKPKVSINLPVALAELVFKSLPDVAATSCAEGYDAENFWTRLRKLGPTEIVEIEGDDGELIQIWLE